MAIKDLIVPGLVGTETVKWLITRGLGDFSAEQGSIADDETGYYHRAPAGADVSFTRKSTDDVPYRRMGQDDGSYRRM